MEPITALGIYLTFSIFSIGMIYFQQDTHMKRIYKNFE